MSTDEFRGISFEDPRRQAEFERLLGQVTAAESDRSPIGTRHKQAEQDYDGGSMSEQDFRAVDDEYIAANNKIADAKRAVDDFLTSNRDYNTH